MNCDGKLRFPNRKTARAKATRLLAKGIVKKRLKPYWCNKHKTYHLTSKTNMDYKIKARKCVNTVK